jgi:hypothetical protein
MQGGRRRRGFERAARIDVAQQLGLPAARARELMLHAAWRDVAGDALARRAPALRVVRGVLEIGIADERWLGTMKSLVPRLAGRLAAHHPELGVRRFRLCGARDAEAGSVLVDSRETGAAAAEPPADSPRRPGRVRARRAAREQRP